jgi:hypothetical protein
VDFNWHRGGRSNQTGHQMAREEHMTDREMFLKALHNAIAWQNRYVELSELLELFCMDAEAAYNEGKKNDVS